jgi:soluble lytic murein transglycosylase
MNILISAIFGLLCSFDASASNGEAYLNKFEAYTAWSKELPDVPSSSFTNFISINSPLNNKLRNKWLYKLAEDKDWQTYVRFYQPTTQVELKCYYATALITENKHEEAIQFIKPLWLSGYSKPNACDGAFNWLLSASNDKNALITKRIKLAIQENNISLARYLFRELSPSNNKDAALLLQIHKQPKRIALLESGPINDDMYLYGLKRLVIKDMPTAEQYWKHIEKNALLSEQQQQQFLSFIALYKAMRNHDDTPVWFAKVKPKYYTGALIDWQVRYALKLNNWKEVERLIRLSSLQDDMSNQYWLARALEGQEKSDEAKAIYIKLSNSRNYYGFLASLRVNVPFKFEKESANQDLDNLKAYQPILEEISSLYEDGKTHQASILINDFVLELPNDERSTLAYWLSKTLKWHAKALYISNNEALYNQITLRFPLAYLKTLTKMSKDHHLSTELIYAVIRQESTFRKKVISHAGAYGLMQILPKTARQMARKNKIGLRNKQQLFQAHTNIKFGTAYLEYLAKRFDNHPLLMAAAYNAGPNQVVYWLKNHPPKQIDIWIETLPWHETRNYLKNIIAFYAVYQHRLNKEPNLQDFLKPLAL